MTTPSPTSSPAPGPTPGPTWTPTWTPQLARPFRWGIAFVWLATGLLVLHPGYRAVGESYLGQLGLPSWLMWLTCAAEVGLGIRVARGPSSAWLTALQVGMIATFTLILGVSEPALLAHPVGVLSKNLPMLALIGVVFLLEREGWTPRAERLLRVGMAVIWLTEGLFPKILFQQAWELEIVAQSGLVPGDPSAFLVFMGCCQIASGVVVLVARGGLRTFVLYGQLLGLAVLPLLVAWQDPSLWVHPFGPLTKNVPILVGTAGVLLISTPFLRSRWSTLVLATYAVPREVLAPHLPPGVELDEREGEVFLSFVTLDLSEVRVLGLPALGYRAFPDVNLRFYVRQGERRGVVFLRELLPLRLPTWVARTLFHEPFDYAAIESSVREEGGELSVERSIERGGRVHRVEVRARAAGEVPPEGSAAHFFKERLWGFGTDPSGGALSYQVEHPAWEVLPIESARLELEFARIYGPEWAFLDELEPHSITLARGSEALVWFPR